MKVREFDADRYDRMKRIDILDMDRIHNAKCLVVGAGAIGNEVVKNLVLSGFTRIDIVDMDDINTSNLSRCVFFGDKDVKNGYKSEILASAVSKLVKGTDIRGIVSRIEDLEDWSYDIVFGCLDNNSARLTVNSHCVFHRIPYVDGATESLRGKVQVVLPGRPCFECTLNRGHMKDVNNRYSCTGDDVHYYESKLPSDITTTSVISAVMVREAMKIISNRTDLCIRDVMFYDGVKGTSMVLEASFSPTCGNHTGEDK